MTERVVTDSNGRKYLTNEPLLHPPECKWVGLTNEERLKIVSGFHATEYALATAVEAKLKEKNDL